MLGRVTIIMLCSLVAACSGDSQPVPPKVKLGKPYSVEGKRYHPERDDSYDETGEASWYGPGFHGNYTANGERFDQNDLTAAHPTLPMPSLVRVTNLDNGRSAIVRINDRGPFTKDRIIDLSKASAEELGVIRTGTANVRVQFLAKESEQLWASLNLDPPREYQVASAGPESMIVENIVSKETPEQAQAAPTGTVTQHDLPPPAGAIARLPDTAAPVETIAYAEETIASETAATEEDQGTTTTMDREIQMAQAAFEPIYPTGEVEVRKAQRIMPKPAPAAAVSEAVPSAGETPAPYIQAGAFSVRENAESLARRLGPIGKAEISQVDSGGKTWFRVRLPVSEDRADSALEKVQGMGLPDARLVRR